MSQELEDHFAMRSPSPRTTILVAALAGTLLLIVGLPSCVKDSFNFKKMGTNEWNPEIAVPMVYTTLTLADLLERNTSDVVEVDNDGFITLVYRDALVSKTAEELLNFNSQNFGFTLAPGIDIPAGLPQGATQTFSDQQVIAFDAGVGNQLDSIAFKSAELTIDVTSGFSANLTIIVAIPSAVKNGTSFADTIQVTPNSSINSTVSLSNYMFDMTNGGTTSNQFQITYNVTITGTGDPISAADQLSIVGSLNNLLFSRLFGVVDVSGIAPESDTVEVSIFNAALSTGSFSLVSPKLKLGISNSWGIPLQITFDTLMGINTNDNVSVDISASQDIPNPWTLPAPSLAQIGQSVRDSIVLSDLINDLIAAKPNLFLYKVNATTSAGGAPGTLFVLDTSKIEVDLEVELPMHGSAFGFALEDTFDLQLNLEAIQTMLLRVHITNGFPIDVDLQITLYDSEIDSAWPILTSAQTLLAAAPVGSDDRVSGTVYNTLDIPFNEAQTEFMRRSNKMIVGANAATLSNGTTPVKIYSDYSLEVKIGFQAQLAIEF